MIDPDSLFRIYLAVEQNPDEAHTSITYNPSRMAGAPIIDALRRYRIIVPSGESPQVQTNMELWKKRQVEILLFISRRLAKFKQQFSEASNGRGVRYAKIVVNELFEPFVIELTLNIYDTPDTAEFTVKISYNDDRSAVFDDVVRLRGADLILRSYLDVADVMQGAAELFFMDYAPKKVDVDNVMPGGASLFKKEPREVFDLNDNENDSD